MTGEGQFGTRPILTHQHRIPGNGSGRNAGQRMRRTVHTCKSSDAGPLTGRIGGSVNQECACRNENCKSGMRTQGSAFRRTYNRLRKSIVPLSARLPQGFHSVQRPFLMTFCGPKRHPTSRP